MTGMNFRGARYASMRATFVLIACIALAGSSPAVRAQPRAKNQKTIVKGIPRNLVAPAQTLMPNESATVRGFVMYQGKNAPYPAARVKVTLIPDGTGPRTATAYTGTDGMYYFAAPSGSYRLQIWSRDKPVKTFKIVVNQKYVNLAAILL